MGLARIAQVAFVIILLFIVTQLAIQLSHVRFQNQILEERMGTLQSEGGKDSVTPLAKHRYQHAQSASRFAIVTAYSGEKYETMGFLADATKRQYAELYGYAFYSDDSFFTDKQVWKEKAAVRIYLLRKYLPKYEWVFWTDCDLFFVDPTQKLESFVDNNYAMVMTKDWGGRQINDGAVFLRNCTEGFKILDMWDKYLRMDNPKTAHDDQMSLQYMLQQEKELGRKVLYKPQRTFNSYPSIGMKDGSYQDILKPGTGHHLYKEGDFAVHVINCLRDYIVKDIICCNGL
eukprot:TRINITY_DN5500_c0_g1_i2.p1 TRINITY_DN5500_c0_g1~~TRINITY_DN5500_c0_g1_i2.p1  ORF type:complete len:288 (-),score=35.85 TRINITY_DN5500_c0_g1_i2:610-1473(-)